MRRLFTTILLAFSLITGASAAGDAFPLVHMLREAIEGMEWTTSVVNLGKQSFSGGLTGLGQPGVCGVGYDINGEWEVLEAYIGFTKNASSRNRAIFSVMADQQVIFTSDEIKAGPDQEPQLIRVPLEGRRIIMLRIEPKSYSGTLGATFGAPTLKRGLTAAEKVMPYGIEINGQKIPYEQSSAPPAVMVPLMVPGKAGEATYTVKVIHNTEGRKVQVLATPTP